MWAIYDRKDGCYVGKPYNNRRRAQTRADTLDMIYGAYRYNVRTLERQQTEKADHAN